MQFLKTLFWVALAVIVVLFGSVNWTTVELRLWGGLVAEIKLPVLVLAAFLLGFIPTLIVHRARLWTYKRRIEMLERQTAVISPAPAAAIPPAPAASPEAGRVATDSKVWPAS